MTEGPLGDLRVVDLSTGIAGAYTTKLLADAGADVVKVEPPGGDPLRGWSATGGDTSTVDGALFRFLAQSKRSVVGALGDPSVDELLADADLVVDSFPAASFDPQTMLDAHPGVVVVSITPYGRGGPLSDRPATEFTVQAECGSIAARGVLEQPPVQAGGRVAEWGAGAVGAAAGLAAVRGARRTGVGRHVDVSWMETMTVATNLFSDLMVNLLGVDPSVLPQPSRTIELPSIEPTADGWVGFNCNAAQQFLDLLIMIERPDLLESGEWNNMAERTTRRDEWNEIMRAWTRRHTTAEVLEQAALFRVPAARVNSAATILDEEQFAARDLFPASADGTFRHPRPPWLLDGRRAADPGPAPRLGEHEPATWRSSTHQVRPPAPRSPVEHELPLAGLKILDLTGWWAGPAATAVFAAMGSDVVHVEAIQRPDGMRFASTTMFVGRDRWWEWSSFYLSINPNKTGITLDLSQADGLALVKRLVAWADVVVENYTPRVLEGFGLDRDAVHALNPGAVMMRMPAFGLSGPWRDRVGFAQTMEQVSGMAWVTGHRGAEPLIPRGPCDPLGGMHGAFALLVALAERDRRGGEGVLVEVPLVEGALNLAAEQVVEHSAYGGLLERDGNRSPHAAPQGIYRCAGGDEDWLALSVATGEQWAALVDVLGRPAWALDPSLSTHAGRRAAHDRLDEELSAWAAGRDRAATVSELLAAGVPAASLYDQRAISTHPQHVARGYVERPDHPVVGERPTFGFPFRMTGVERWLRTPAPTMGQHNEDVLGKVLGLSADELDRLAADQVIGEAPLGV